MPRTIVRPNARVLAALTLDPLRTLERLVRITGADAVHEGRTDPGGHVVLVLDGHVDHARFKDLADWSVRPTHWRDGR